MEPKVAWSSLLEPTVAWSAQNLHLREGFESALVKPFSQFFSLEVWALHTGLNIIIWSGF